MRRLSNEGIERLLGECNYISEFANTNSGSILRTNLIIVELLLRLVEKDTVVRGR